MACELGMVKVLYFANLREDIGTAGEEKHSKNSAYRSELLGTEPTDMMY